MMMIDRLEYDIFSVKDTVTLTVFILFSSVSTMFDT